MPGYARWFPPLCLVLAIAALLVFSGDSECPDNVWDSTPAIARVGDSCVYALQFNTYLRDLSLNLGLPSQGTDADETVLGEYLRGREQLAVQFGLENAGFAALAQDLALYRLAVTGGQHPPDADVMVAMGVNRERIRGLRALLDLHELAIASDLQGFRDLLETPNVAQLIPVQEEEHLLMLFEEAANIDLTGAVRGMEIHEALIESVGEGSYWNEVFFEQARWRVTIESFRLSADVAGGHQPPALWWQNLREKTWVGTVIELTDAAPESVTLSEVRRYMDGLHALERELLMKWPGFGRRIAGPEACFSPLPRPTPHRSARSAGTPGSRSCARRGPGGARTPCRRRTTVSTPVDTYRPA